MEAAKKRVAELERQRRELYAQQQKQEREARQEELAIRCVLHKDQCVGIVQACDIACTLHVGWELFVHCMLVMSAD